MLQRRSARRGRKQDAERKRRERLNTSMIALKQLVCKETHTEDASNTDDSKLEKAQILEATVEYVRQKQQEEEQQPRPTQLYTMGFNTAAQLTLEFLSECDQELSQKLHSGLRDYLSRKAKELQESGPEGEKRQAKDAPGKCRSPILRHCREARHKPTQASGRGERQREEPLAQTPSPSPSPRLEPLRSVSSNRQCFASLPGTPTMVWGSGMYPSVAINSSVMYPSPSSSPLPRHPAAPRVAAPAGVEPKTTWRPW
nr:hypothetical protein BaRGS_021504 [Batillaria attramentaria]